MESCVLIPKNKIMIMLYKLKAIFKKTPMLYWLYRWLYEALALKRIDKASYNRIRYQKNDEGSFFLR